MLAVILFLCALVISVISVIVFRFFVGKFGYPKLFDVPDDNLKKHTKPIPYAGTAIFAAFIMVLLGLRLFTHFETGTLHQLRGIVYGGTIIYFLGLLDDMYAFDFKVKFLWQIVGTVILIYYGIYIKLFANQLLNIALSMFWVILVVNAINIIDIHDGLAVGISVICALGFFAISLPTKMLYVNLASVILCGSLLGFWIFNKPPAQIFMGDAGSLFVGFILAALSMGADYSKVNMVGLFAPLIILGIPLFETIFVSCLRLKNGQPVFKGSKDHYALRLTIAGFSAWQINLISYAVSLFLTVAAVLMTIVSARYAFLVLVSIFVFGMVGSSMLANIDISEK